MSEQRDRHEQHMDTVLQALSHATPDGAMQDRLLATLRSAAMARNAADAHTGQPLRRWPTRTAASWRAAAPWLAAAALLFAVGGTLLHRLTAHPMQQPGEAAALEALSAEDARQPGNTADAVSASLPWPVHRPLRSHATRMAPALWTPNAVQPASALDASFPPPPLPMTQQERLLLRLARHEPTEQLARLIGPAQEATFQQQKDAVTEFFATAPIPDEDEDEEPVASRAPTSTHPADKQIPTSETP